MEWQRAARDHGTFCVSCHTCCPTASRAALRESLADHDTLSANERRLIDNVTRRVRLWKDVGPYYGDRADKAVESRGTEAVLNALILAAHDARSGRLSADTRTALENMWALQEPTGDRAGAWPWLQFGLSPWEDGDVTTEPRIRFVFRGHRSGDLPLDRRDTTPTGVVARVFGS
jgi:hypothetical protein